jgi:hypothetical protein
MVQGFAIDNGLNAFGVMKAQFTLIATRSLQAPDEISQ